MSPPCCQISGQMRQVVSSSPVPGQPKPAIPASGSLSSAAVLQEVVPGPIVVRIRDAGVVEDLLVVDDGQVVDERRNRARLVVDGDRLLAGVDEAVPVEIAVVDRGRQIEELLALREVGEVGAVDVGDVGVVVGLQAGGHLLQHPVGVDPARVLGDDHVRMAAVEVVDHRLQQLGRALRLAMPELDLDRLAAVARRGVVARVAAAAATRDCSAEQHQRRHARPEPRFEPRPHRDSSHRDSRIRFTSRAARRRRRRCPRASRARFRARAGS